MAIRDWMEAEWEEDEAVNESTEEMLKADLSWDDPSLATPASKV